MVIGTALAVTADHGRLADGPGFLSASLTTLPPLRAGLALSRRGPGRARSRHFQIATMEVVDNAHRASRSPGR